MQSTLPFTHLIETPYGKYFFDVNTDKIFNIKNIFYQSLKRYLSGEKEANEEYLKNELKKMQNIGLLKDTRPTVMKHSAADFMNYYLNYKMGNITLQLTQNCNFRCAYCVYGQDTPLNRRHSSKRMTFEIAEKAVDFIFKRSRDAETVNIGFYGGEPLLEFGLLKKTVLYAKKVFSGKPLTFSITTNCSLINDEIIDFLKLHSIHILISLDGPKNIHDSKRVFAVNGCGTFDAIMKKLEFIKGKYPDFYKKSISFNTVVDPSKEFDCVNQMYISNELLKDANSMSNLIDDSYSVEKNTYSEKYIEQRRYEDFKILLTQLGRIQGKNLSAISRQAATKE